MTDLVLFDLDGTLTDSAEGITKSIQHAIAKKGLKATREELLPFVGPPLKESFIKYFPQIDPDEAIRDYREYYAVKGIFENAVYPGVMEALEKLKEKGIPMILTTSKPEPYAIQICDHFGFTPYLDGIYGALMDSSRVKKEDIIEYALEQYPNSHPVMVGDRKFDIEGAHQHHIPAVGVLYGFGDRQELEEAGADALIEDLRELPGLIEKDEIQLRNQG